jgi:hypothetical protein
MWTRSNTNSAMKMVSATMRPDVPGTDEAENNCQGNGACDAKHGLPAETDDLLEGDKRAQERLVNAHADAIPKCLY